MRAILAASLALSVLAAPASAEKQVQVFTIHFHSKAEAWQVVEPLLSPDGSITLQRDSNSISVQDDVAVLQRIAAALAEWDVAPPNYVIRVRMLIGTTTPPTSGKAAPLISGIGQDLQKVFHFTSYREVDTLQVTAADGGGVEASLGGRYHIRFTVRGVPQDDRRIQLVGLELSRKMNGGGQGGGEVLRSILKSNVSLGIGQTFVLGAARSEDANQGLVLVLWAQREDAQ